MNIKGMVWAGFKTTADKFDSMVGFFRDTMGFKVYYEDTDVVTFILPNGDLFEVLGPTQAVELNDMPGLKLDFLVDDVDQAAAELTAKGVKLAGDVFHASDQDWVNFVGPNGSYFGITSLFAHPAHAYDKVVLFYGPHGKNGWLSNWYLSPIFLKGKIWASVEHYYHAQKFAGTPEEEICRRLATPRETLEFSRRPDVHPDPEWDKKKLQVMAEAVRAKFTQNPELTEMLLATGDNEIAEESPIDSFWGLGKDKDGRNELGQIIMKVREDLRRK